jgi:hypothetical protein
MSTAQFDKLVAAASLPDNLRSENAYAQTAAGGESLAADGLLTYSRFLIRVFCVLVGVQLGLAGSVVPLAGFNTGLPQARAQIELGTVIDSRERVMRALRVPNGSIRIDGVMDEEYWARAEPGSGFRQTDPLDGQPAEQDTEVRILYDDNNLYVGGRMHEPDISQIRRQLTPRDDTPQTVDFFDISIDPDYDRTSAYLFRVTVSGVQRDEFLHHDTQPDAAWNGIWESGVSVGTDSWYAELRIPLSTIRFNASPEPQVWGLDFIRRRAAAAERAIWAWKPRSVSGRVSRFGQLQGLVFTQQERNIEVIPYAMGRFDWAEAVSGNPFFDGTKFGFNAGADIRYGITSNFILDATINPDFGQVDVDPQVINLTAFETNLQERRPFFTRDDRIFDFNLSGGDLVHSRRIGRAPQGDAPSGYDFEDIPIETTILGAAKVTGTTVGGLTLGGLAAYTASEFGRAYDVDTDETIRFEVEPATIYGVGRIQQDLREGQTNIGGILTIVNRDLPNDGSLDFLPKQAFSGGMNFEHSWADQEWVIWGFLVGTQVEGSTEAITRLQRSSRHYFQRPDQDYMTFDPTRTSLSGYEWRVEFERLAAEHWTGAIWFAERSVGFDPNDIGFSNATERLDNGLRIEYEERNPGMVFRNYNLSVSTIHNWRHSVVDDFFSWDAWGYAQKSSNYSFDANANFLNYWSVSAGYTYHNVMLSDTQTRGGPLMVNPGSHELEFGLNSDQRNIIALEFGLEYEDNMRGGRTLSPRLGLNARPTEGLTLNVEFEYENSHDARQFVTSVTDPSYTSTYGGRYFFADLFRDEFSIEASFDWILSPTLSVRGYFQPLLSTGNFRTYKQLALPESFNFRTFSEGSAVVAGGATSCIGGDLCKNNGRIFIDYTGDGLSDTSFREQNFNVSSLLGNVVIRWEYSPGSALFFVWQHVREHETDLGVFDLWTDARAIFEERGGHVFMVKATRYMSF